MQLGTTAIAVSIFWRFAIAALVMTLIAKLCGRLHRLTLRDQLLCLIQGCCVFSFNFVCFYHAAQWINSGLESVIFSMAVLFNAINSFLFFKIRPPVSFFPAALLGIAGIVLLFWRDLTATRIEPRLFIGIGLSALGTLGFSLGNMISLRHQRRGLDILTTNSQAMLYGALVMGTLALSQGANFMPPLSARYLGSLLYLALFGSVIAFVAYFTLVSHIGAGQAAYSTLLFPLVALAISTLYEGYVWHPSAVAGLLLILTGNLVMFARPQRPLFRRRGAA